MASLTLVFAIPVVKLVRVQVLDAERYVAFGQSQRLRSEELPAERGSITDRDGLPLALSEPKPTVWVDPRVVTDPAGSAEQLAALTGVAESTIRDRLTSSSSFEYVAHHVKDKVAAEIQELDLPGVYLVDESARIRPAGALGESIVGDVVQGNAGSTGLELYYDDLLTGIPGQIRFERSIDGQKISVGERRVQPAVPGADIALTIHRGIQYRAEEVLGAQIEKTGALGGWMLVADPSNGELYAVVNMARSEDGEARSVRHNKAFTANYDPGSILKVATLAAALEAGTITPQKWIDVPPRLQIHDKLFSDEHRSKTEPMTPTDILVRSSNVGSITIARSVGAEVLHTMLTKLGLGRLPDVGFPGEATGRLNPVERWSGTDIGSVAIGQGVSATGQQMLDVYSTIANGGVSVQPSLVRTIIEPDGRRHLPESPAVERVLSAEVAAELTEMLVEVVDEGTGSRAAIDGYRVAGKTGTAWKFFEDTGYLDRRGDRQYISSFVGFAPASNPRLVALVSLDQPDPSAPEGGLVAAPVFSEVMAYALRALRVAPSDLADPAGPVRAPTVPGSGPDGEAVEDTNVGYRPRPVGTFGSGRLVEPEHA